MFNKMIVYKALKKSLPSYPVRKSKPILKTSGEDGLISLLIHDVFGGEILKTHTRKYWHFYNRIDGERVDLTVPGSKEAEVDFKFEDIPSTPDETSDYVDQTDYSNFFTRFVMAFEDTIGLEKFHPGLSS